MIPGQNTQVGTPTIITLGSMRFRPGTSIISVAHAIDHSGRHVPGMDHALKLGTGLSEDCFAIPLMPEGLRLQVVVLGLHGSDQIPLCDAAAIHVSIGSGPAFPLSDAAGKRVALIGQVYQRSSIQRFRFMDQGWDVGYSAWADVSGFDFGLDEVIAAVSCIKEEEVAPRTTRREETSPPAPTNKPDGDRVMHLTYRAARGGTSERRIVMTSVKHDRFQAREHDGHQNKTFLLAGVVELYDVETGEDMMPIVAASRTLLCR